MCKGKHPMIGYVGSYHGRSLSETATHYNSFLDFAAAMAPMFAGLVCLWFAWVILVKEWDGFK